MPTKSDAIGRGELISEPVETRSMMMKILRIAYQPYKWLVYIPLIGISMAFFGTGAIIASYFSKKAACMFFGAWWARLMCGATPMLLKVEGREHIDHSKSYVVVANHQSIFDMLSVFGHLKMNLRWVMKKTLRKVPFLGFSSARVGNVFVDRKNTTEDIKRLQGAKGMLKDGISIFFFAEGTRSLDGKLKEFKKGAFMMAIEMGLPILPVALVGTNKILPAKTLDLFPGRASMIINEPVDTSGYTKENVSELVEKVRNTIAGHLVNQ